MLTLQETIVIAGKEYYHHYMDGGNDNPIPVEWLSQVYEILEDILHEKIMDEVKKLRQKH
jgi:hypothetical protein